MLSEDIKKMLGEMQSEMLSKNTTQGRKATMQSIECKVKMQSTEYKAKDQANNTKQIS